ncbi:hypothetical protein M5K25_024468 [Dendrobium thyrsiflorum]|uniref:Secreted protein n=1 Tax=Dendrobium thyrsiflorum TaxID=117978 RepID=A0ABD0U1Y8_DENTH
MRGTHALYVRWLACCVFPGLVERPLRCVRVYEYALTRFWSDYSPPSKEIVYYGKVKTINLCVILLLLMRDLWSYGYLHTTCVSTYMLNF